jgi:hypothetical protein
LSVLAPSVEKSVASKDICHEELEQVVDYFPKYHTKFVLGDFNAPDHTSRYQQIWHVKYLLRVYSVEIPLIMDSEHVRNM